MKIFELLSSIKRFFNGEISTKKLKKRGLVCGKCFNRGSNVFIDPTFPFLIEIGNNVTISIRTVILSHDASTVKLFDNHIGKLGKVSIGNNVFIGANCTILPNTVIGDNTIVGAGSVVSGLIPDNVVVCGNPAHVICTIDEYKNKHLMQSMNKTFTLSKRKKDKQMIDALVDETKSGIVYIK